MSTPDKRTAEDTPPSGIISGMDSSTPAVVREPPHNATAQTDHRSAVTLLVMETRPNPHPADRPQHGGVKLSTALVALGIAGIPAAVAGNLITAWIMRALGW